MIMRGLTLYTDLANTVVWGKSPPPTGYQDYPELTVGVPPAAVYLDVNDPKKHAILLLSHKTDCGGIPLLSNPDRTIGALEKQFNRTFDIAEGCLPQGRYALNLVYETGQAWTVPNEAGVCAKGEPSPTNDPNTCGTPPASRARLPSQDAVFTIGAPDDPQWCLDHPTPAACLPVKSATP